MMPIVRIVSVVAAIAIVAGWFFSLSEPTAADVLAVERTVVPQGIPADSTKPLFVGAAGCSAASCHGGREILGGEYTHWATHDSAHRRAYNVLLSDVSRTMATKLGIVAAHKETRCLACHSMDAGATNSDSTVAVHAASVHGPRFAIEFGVACESCHGAAGQWLARHTERSWKNLSDHQKSEFGFRNLRSLAERADACIACHVGSPRATVDHDLIAAGHPRLNFELSAYHAMLPKHWNESAALRQQPDQELKLWMLGQVNSAKAVADIAFNRAEAEMSAKREPGLSQHVIPDLAEFDCHACHHDLAERTWRGRLFASKNIGEPQWGSWSIAPATWLARQSKPVLKLDLSAAANSLSQWTQLMQNSKLRGVQASELATVAGKTRTDLSAWSRMLESSHCDADQAQLFLRQLLATESDAAFAITWEGQTQRYLALIAAHQSLRDLSFDTSASPSQSVSANSLTELQKLLKFPLGFATPHDYRAEEVQQIFRRLQQ